MNTTLVKALVGLVLAGLLFARAVLLIRHHASVASLLQLCGSACLMIVVLTHIAEGLRVLAFMGWGEAHSAGHYLDLTSAVLGAMLLSAGYSLSARARRRGSH